MDLPDNMTEGCVFMKKLRIKLFDKPQKSSSFWSNGNIVEDSQRYDELKAKNERNQV